MVKSKIYNAWWMGQDTFKGRVDHQVLLLLVKFLQRFDQEYNYYNYKKPISLHWKSYEVLEVKLTQKGDKFTLI